MAVRNQAGMAEVINLNPEQIRQLRQVRLIETVLAMDYHNMTMTDQGLPENVNAVGLISNGFDDLGVPPLLGRGLLRSDALDGQEPQPVVVLSYRFWQERLGGDSQVVGKTLRLDHKSFTVVGVAAPRFRWYSADVYLPLKMDYDPQHFCVVDFRLRLGVTRQTTDAALQPLLNQFAREMPKQFPERFQVQVEGLNEWVNRSIRGTLYLLFGAVALLLAIGCGNVSILLLAQGTARQHEFAVRAAVGADSRQTVRQLLTESMVLAAIGLALGVSASYGILAMIKAVLPPNAFAPEVVIRINLPVLFFSGCVATITALLFGLWPALQLSRTQAGPLMVANTRRVAGSVRGRRTHNALIAVQIALTLVLLSSAGTAARSFLRLIHTPLGYDPHHVMSVGVPLHDNSYGTWAARAAYFEQLRAKVAETPGVALAAISSNATPPRNGWYSRFEVLGLPVAAQQRASVNLVSPGYFDALRIPLLEGRVWSQAENSAGAHRAIINRTLANRYFPNGAAIGRSLKLPDLDNRPPAVLAAPNISGSWLQIVGIVSDARNDGLSNPITPAVYVPYTLRMTMGTQILVKSEPPPLTLVRAVRTQLTTVDPDQQSFSTIDDLDSWISGQPEWQQEHLVAWIFAVFGGLGLALAVVGLYSVVSYTVVQRTNEFGIRIALGAQPGDVLRMVFRSILGSVAAGVLTGLLLARLLSEIVAEWAKGNSGDPMILLAGTLLLSVASALASAIPAWHASKIDPMTALRCE
jgi:predicted permease